MLSLPSCGDDHTSSYVSPSQKHFYTACCMSAYTAGIQSAHSTRACISHFQAVCNAEKIMWKGGAAKTHRCSHLQYTILKSVQAARRAHSDKNKICQQLEREALSSRQVIYCHTHNQPHTLSNGKITFCTVEHRLSRPTLQSETQQLSRGSTALRPEQASGCHADLEQTLGHSCIWQRQHCTVLVQQGAWQRVCERCDGHSTACRIYT